jgi:diaminopimelate decarboxylase
MQPIHYHDNKLMMEQTQLSDVAEQFGTPCYVYSRAAIEANWHAFDDALAEIPHRICYAVKANSNIAILNLLARLHSGFDIVSLGELERVIAAGGDPTKVVFSGVGKNTLEITRALEIGILCFNVESEDEIHRIHTIAKAANKIATITLRINPNIDAKTHPYIATGLKENKFGIDIDRISAECAHIKTLAHVKLIGIACHIGSQLTTIEPFVEAANRILDLAETITRDGFALQHINIGGGLGVRYQNEQPPSISAYIQKIREQLKKTSLEIIIEPGRSIIANAGVLLTRIEYIKQTAHKNFAIVDAAMNDLIRPALYDAWQEIKTVNLNTDLPVATYDIVGPVCETADFLGKDRQLQLQTGELLAVISAGAYGFSMSSNYNSRPRVAEVMIDKDKMFLIRRRETIAELFASESIISE